MTNDRIHLDSIVTESFAYDMSAGHLMPAGSEGLIVTGCLLYTSEAADDTP